MNTQKTKNVEKTLPITWESWDEFGDPGDFIFYNVEFTSDWGPFKTGDTFKSISLSMKSGVIESYNEVGDVVLHHVEFKLTPV